MDLKRWLRHRSAAPKSPPLRLFLPGFGAPACLYRPGLPAGWTEFDLPRFRGSGGSYDYYRAWLIETLAGFGSLIWLAGHSMGGALAISAAAALPERVERLVLISPAGLSLSKPIRSSLHDFAGQLVRRRYPSRPVLEGIGDVLAAPFAAFAAARSVRALDLSREMRAVRRHDIQTTVVACSTDTLVTAAHCRRAATLLGASYRELEQEGGHMWMLLDWSLLASELTIG